MLFGNQSFSLKELLHRQLPVKAAGREKNRMGAASGSPRGYAMQKCSGQIHIMGTIVSAAPYQQLREGELALKIRQQDLRYARYAKKGKRGILFLVDTSHSLNAQRQLSYVKGTIYSILSEIYSRRDAVSLVTFGNARADVVLPFTRSVELAKKKLEYIPANGNTPLSMGLRLALSTLLLQEQKQHLAPVLVVFTDGKGNYDELPGAPRKLILDAARQIAEAEIETFVVDTDNSAFNSGMAKKLAQQMQATYLTLTV